MKVLKMRSEDRFSEDRVVLSVAAMEAAEHWSRFIDLIQILELTRQQSFLVIQYIFTLIKGEGPFQGRVL